MACRAIISLRPMANEPYSPEKSDSMRDCRAQSMLAPVGIFGRA